VFIVLRQIRRYPAQGGFSSAVTLRRRRQAHLMDERPQDLIRDLGEQFIGSL
jgi:hypothetical protein